MKNYKLHTSEGVRDYLGLEACVSNEVINKLNNLYTLNGFELVKTPTFEYIDVYNLDSSLQKPSLYNLINRQGEVLALRNDMTASIRRVVESNKNLSIPHKFCYCAPTFRYPRLYQGKSHEFIQSGIEIIGGCSVKADVLTIRLAYESLILNNIKDFNIHIGSSEFIITLLKDLNINLSDINSLIDILENRNYIALKKELTKIGVVDKYSDLILRIISTAGRTTYLNNILKEVEGLSCSKILYKLLDLYNELMVLNMKNQVVFDFGIYSYAKYYTGFVFQIFSSGVGSSLVDGGRCDNLVDEGMVGFGLNVDVITTYIIDNLLFDKRCKKYLIHYDCESCIKALNYASMLRDSGMIVCESLFDNCEDAIKYFNDNNYDEIIIFSKNEIING